jgi:hypothetical protein
MKEQASLIQSEPDTHHPSRPIYLQKVIGGEDYMAPDDALGKLEKEIYSVHQAAEKYDAESYMGQRFNMALGIRNNALNVLETHNGNTKAAIGSLRQERRQALKKGDSKTAENAYLELRILRRIASPIRFDPDQDIIVSKLEKSSSFDPEYGEIGFFRAIGSSVVRNLIGNPFNGKPDVLEDYLRMLYKSQHGGRGFIHDRRKRKVASISERYAN